MDTSGYQRSDLDDVEFYCENDQVDLDAVFKPSIDTLFLSTAFADMKMGGSAGDPILLEEEEDEHNSPPTTPASERPIQPLHCWEVVHMEHEEKMFLTMFIEIFSN